MIEENLKSVYERIDAAARESGRTKDDILLVAVTKTHPPEIMNEAISCGVTDVGENRPQEVRDKYPFVKEARWHLIGQLQTNKIKYVIDKVCMIHSVDSIHLMEEINSHAKKRNLTMDILIQVNISGEETKSGIEPSELDSVLDYAKNLSNIRVRGLMTIAPKAEEAVVYKCFSDMNKLYLETKQKSYENVSMDYLSMGMSNDFEIAIRCGANLVRIGSSIFGLRQMPVASCPEQRFEV